MSTFTPTVNTVGDISITNSIIDKTITELHDNIITNIGAFSFQEYAQLNNVKFESVVQIDSNAFSYCTNLKKIDLYVVESIGNYVFNYSNNIETLVIRSDKMCKIQTDSFINSTISSGECYIYVPTALVDTYKTDSVWSTYANQIRAIEDYPEITGGPVE